MLNSHLPIHADNTIYLRAFAAVSDEPAAKTVCVSIKQRLSQHGEITRCDTPKQYWKIPEYWELFAELRPRKPAPQAFDDILSELGSGWEIHRFVGNSSWAVWNAGPDATFVIPEVRWANLECLHRPETASTNAK